MKYGLVSNLKLTYEIKGCVVHKLLWATTIIPTANVNDENHSFVGKLNHPKGYRVINHEYRIITRGRNVCFLVDPIQILEMHHNISENGRCYGKWEFQRWQRWKCKSWPGPTWHWTTHVIGSPVGLVTFDVVGWLVQLFGRNRARP